MQPKELPPSRMVQGVILMIEDVGGHPQEFARWGFQTHENVGSPRPGHQKYSEIGRSAITHEGANEPGVEGARPFWMNGTCAVAVRAFSATPDAT